MALKINEKFAPRANPPTTNYPDGSIKNESTPGAKDGTPLDAEWGNDYVGFTDALLAEAGIDASGNPDTALVSQRVDAIKSLHINDLSIPYVYKYIDEFINSSIILPIGKFVHINEASDGNGFGSDWVVFETSTVTPNGSDIIQSTAQPTISIVSKTSQFYKRIDIGDRLFQTNSSDPMVNVNRNVSGTGTNGHCFSDSSLITRAGDVSYASYDVRFTVDGNNDYGHFAPFQNAPLLSTTGTTGILYGYLDIPSLDAGAVSTRYGVKVNDVARSGGASLTNNYGVYVEELTGDSAQVWSIVAKGTGMRSLFEGRIVNQGGMGSATSSTDTAGWDINPSASAGMRISGKTGTSYDFSIMQPGQLGFIQTNLTGTDSMKFWGNVSFNGKEPAAPPALPSPSTDLNTTIALVNSIRQLLVDVGLAT